MKKSKLYIYQISKGWRSLRVWTGDADHARTAESIIRPDAGLSLAERQEVLLKALFDGFDHKGQISMNVSTTKLQGVGVRRPDEYYCRAVRPTPGLQSGTCMCSKKKGHRGKHSCSFCGGEWP